MLRPRFRPVTLREGLVLCLVLVAFAGVTVFVVEEICSMLRCPKTGIPIPTIVAILLAVPQQYRVLELWKSHPRVVLAATVAAYACIAAVLWGVVSGRI